VVDLPQVDKNMSKKISKLAIISLLCGILGLITSLTYALGMKVPGVGSWLISNFKDILIHALFPGIFMAFPPGVYLFIILTITLATIALVKIHKNPNLTGKNLALIAIALGIAMILIYSYVILTWKTIYY
tara:strand:+ start:62 stop:451 length:390 start_codon:yes stop_codon:yes gene_type:complete